jgi:hypothetical protein
MNIESRVIKLEDRIGVSQKAETVTEMFEKMQRGEYGRGYSLAGIVAAYLSAPDKGQCLESLRQELPGPLVDVFANHFNDGA